MRVILFLNIAHESTFFRIIFVIPPNFLFMNEIDFLTVKELCEWIRLSRSKVYSLLKDNKIPHAKVGGKILFDKEKIKVWIDNQSK